MRIHGIAAFASIVLLAVSSAGYYRAIEKAQGPADPAKAIAEAKRRFLEGRATPDLGFDPRAPGPLLDPALSLPSTHLFPYAEIGALYRYARSCDEGDLAHVASPGLAKAKIWHAHVCTKAPLPAGFFEERPFMHPSGASFVRLAFEIDAAPPGWLEAHLPYLHASELALIASSIVLSPELRLLSGSTPAELAAFSAHAPMVLTGDHVFFFERAPGDDNAPSSGGAFRGFPIAAWSKVQEDAPFRALPFARDMRCVAREGNVCWVRGGAPLEASTRIYGIAAAVALLVLAASIASLFAGRIRAQRRAEEERRFALTTLAHELRTPATALSLSLETLRADFDRLPESFQTELLRMAGEVERLNRVIAGSARYLRSSARSPEDRYAIKTIASISGFIEGVLEPRREEIQLEKPPVDRPFRTDPYWLSLSIANLVENALVHGQRPVRVGVSVSRDALEVRIEDSGSIEGKTLDDLARPFSAGPRSKGLGLGLSIVRRTLQDLGGTLRLETDPTAFILRLEDAGSAGGEA